MRHGSLFSGIGGFDLAAEWMGWENVFNCDIEESCRRLLRNYWPNSISYDDITKTDFTIHRGSIDIITGGDPCQPHSYAGKRRGKDDERYLWGEMFRCVREIKPSWVVNENVTGTIDNGVLDGKIGDLESEGYTCWPPVVLPANAFGAIHRRNRVWLVAYSERNIKSWEEQCLRNVDGMGREFKPLAWHYDWQYQIGCFRGMDDGIPNRVDRTDGTRNAIVPQVALQIFKAIQQYNK